MDEDEEIKKKLEELEKKIEKFEKDANNLVMNKENIRHMTRESSELYYEIHKFRKLPQLTQDKYESKWNQIKLKVDALYDRLKKANVGMNSRWVEEIRRPIGEYARGPQPEAEQQPTSLAQGQQPPTEQLPAPAQAQQQGGEIDKKDFYEKQKEVKKNVTPQLKEMARKLLEIEKDVKNPTKDPYQVFDRINEIIKERENFMQWVKSKKNEGFLSKEEYGKILSVVYDFDERVNKIYEENREQRQKRTSGISEQPVRQPAPAPQPQQPEAEQQSSEEQPSALEEAEKMEKEVEEIFGSRQPAAPARGTGASTGKQQIETEKGVKKLRKEMEGKLPEGTPEQPPQPSLPSVEEIKEATQITQRMLNSAIKHMKSNMVIAAILVIIAFIVAGMGFIWGALAAVFFAIYALMPSESKLLQSGYNFNSVKDAIEAAKMLYDLDNEGEARKILKQFGIDDIPKTWREEKKKREEEQIKQMAKQLQKVQTAQKKAKEGDNEKFSRYKSLLEEEKEEEKEVETFGE